MVRCHQLFTQPESQSSAEVSGCQVCHLLVLHNKGQCVPHRLQDHDQKTNDQWPDHSTWLALRAPDTLCSNARNAFPAHYSQIHEGHQPAELYPEYVVVEYVLPQSSMLLSPPAFLLVVDLCVSQQELQVRTSVQLLQILSRLPGK